MNFKIITILFLAFLSIKGMSQSNELTAVPVKKDKSVQINLNESGDHYVKFTGLLQVWLRHTEMNPGTTVNGYDVAEINDISLRRLRFQVYSQLTDDIFLYVQFGQNNFSPRSPKYVGAFFHDAIGEVRVHKNHLSIGGGLTAWSGLLRYSSPSIGSIMSLDVPLYQQATNSINDQFLRKLSVYAKGQLGRLDYRLALTTPMDITSVPAGVATIDSTSAMFSPEPASYQYQGYFKFQFFEKESNLMPFNVGTYIGEKKILCLGAGFIAQPNAMWKINTEKDTIHQSMILTGVDVFFETPLNKNKSTALTIYAAFSNYNFGDRYLRNVGVMNPGNGVNSNQTMNGTGNAFAMIGTGNTVYAQAGLAFGNNIITKGGKLQPYIASQISDYEALDDLMIMTEGGVNWYLHGNHSSKLSLNYQNRPIFEVNTTGDSKVTSYKGMAQVQLQVFF